jgi:hypothetical protein
LRLRIGQHLRFETGSEARATVVANVGDPPPASATPAGKTSSTAPAAKATPVTAPTTSTRTTTPQRRVDSTASAATP